MPHSKLFGFLILGALLLAPFSFSTDITRIQSIAHADGSTGSPPPHPVAPAPDSNRVTDDDTELQSSQFVTKAGSSNEVVSGNTTDGGIYFLVKLYVNLIFVSIQI